MDLQVAHRKRTEALAVSHLTSQLKQLKALFVSCGLEFEDLFDTTPVELKQNEEEALARLWEMQTDIYQEIRNVIENRANDIVKCEAALHRILGWKDVDKISDDAASDMTHAQCKAAVGLLLPLLKNTRAALKFNEGNFTITEGRLQFNKAQVGACEDFFSKLIQRAEGLGKQGELGCASVDDPLKSLKRSIDSMKKKLESAEAALKQNSLETIRKERDDALQLHVKALEDVDCVRTDRQRDREEIERLNEQLERLRAEKERVGGSKNRNNKPK